MSEFWEWTPITEALPKEDGKYLCTNLYFGKPYINCYYFTKDLYKLDKHDFCEHKGQIKPGFYSYDGENGYFEIGVIAWMRLPEPYNEGDKI